MPKRILEGEVVSDKQDKTITVRVERRFMHPLYKKYIKKTDQYAAHDEANSAKVGERVSIEECRPISKRKTWTLVGGAEAVSKKSQKKTVKTAKPPAAKSAKKAAPKKEAAPKAAVKKTTTKKKDA